MTGQVLNNSHLVQHHDLRNESNRFEPKRETPAEGPCSPASVKDAGEDESNGE